MVRGEGGRDVVVMGEGERCSDKGGGGDVVVRGEGERCSGKGGGGEM